MTCAPSGRRSRRTPTGCAAVVADLVREANGRGTAKRLLPAARAAGYAGSDANFRRLVAGVKRQVRGEIGRHQRRPAVWTPGETVVIDWGLLPCGLKVFCAVLAWSRVRFVRVARDETAATTLAMLADCFDTLGGVPGKVLADRMGCLKGGTVAGVVIPTPDYVRFATHYRFRPDFCHPADPESKGIVENLVGYAKTDLVLPDSDDLTVLNDACRCGASRSTPVCTPRPAQSRTCAWWRNGRCCASCRCCARGSGVASCARSTSCPRSGSRRRATRSRTASSARQVEAVTFDGRVRIYDLDGGLVADHVQLAPGEAAVLDEHYPTPRRAPSRGPRARTDAEREFLALGEPAEEFIRAVLPPGRRCCPRRSSRSSTISCRRTAPSSSPRPSPERARFGRFKAADVRSILAIGTALPEPAAGGDNVVVGLPTAEVRSFDAYRIENLA